ncbi:unnamed protein product [Oikopleura dioica]|uniref:PDZ domain-containing protein n=1 Tax=Oikopleura dioica TaxID=34765 RepID=E4Z764_OIKDI|nr:unnamed protein product [Oikopleura dioica]
MRFGGKPKTKKVFLVRIILKTGLIIIRIFIAREVIIEKGTNGYGLKFETRVFVESVLLGFSTGIIEDGNEILEINGQSVRNLSESEVFNLLESSKKAKVKLRKINST